MANSDSLWSQSIRPKDEREKQQTRELAELRMKLADEKAKRYLVEHEVDRLEASWAWKVIDKIGQLLTGKIR